MKAALEIVEEEGLGGLNMAKLASQLGCGVMTLYGHIQDKDELLSLICARVTDQLWDELPAGTGALETLREAAIGLRRGMLENAALAPLLIEKRMWSPDVAQVIETVMEQFVAEGWTPDDALRAYRSVEVYTLGFVVYEIPRRVTSSPTDHEQWWARALLQLDPNEYPVFHEVQTALTDGASTTQFEFGLDNLLAGLKAGHAQAGPPGGSCP